MNESAVPYPALRDYWQPVLAAEALRDRPVPVSALGEALVLARLDGAVRCFVDRCPHRLMPLSAGRIVGDRLACCYHGWEFAADGRLVHTPGRASCDTRAALRRVAVREHDGLLWVNPAGASTSPVGFTPLPEHIHTQVYRQLRCGLFHTVENFLDPCHTPYVHGGILRSSGPQHMRLEQTVHASGFATTYYLEQQQNGLINRLFDPGADRNVARFEMPGRVELDYLKGDELLLRVALLAVAQDDATTGMWARLYVPQASAVPAALRFAALRPFVSTLFRQDRDILERQQRARERYGEHYVFADTDVVARPLWDLLHGTEPTATTIDRLDFG